MILFAHMLFGAAIGAQINNPYIAIPLAFLGHYFLDLFPHIEYSVDNIRNKLWKKSLPDFLKVSIDFWLVFLVIFLLSPAPAGHKTLIYICAFVAAIPDALTLISSIFENKILKIHDTIHTKHIHYLTKQKNFPLFWKIFTQVASVVICLLLLR